MLSNLVIIILLLTLIGTLPTWPHSASWGYLPSVAVGFVLAVLLVMSEMYRRRRRFPVGVDMIHQGQTDQKAYILASGWACSQKILRSGARQIVDIQIPGDFPGLRSVLFRTSDHNAEPITLVHASEIRERDLLHAFSQTPRLATAVLQAASRDEAMVVEHLVDVGRRSSLLPGTFIPRPAQFHSAVTAAKNAADIPTVSRQP